MFLMRSIAAHAIVWEHLMCELQVVKTLIANGADPMALHSDGFTPMLRTCRIKSSRSVFRETTRGALLQELVGAVSNGTSHCTLPTSFRGSLAGTQVQLQPFLTVVRSTLNTWHMARLGFGVPTFMNAVRAADTAQVINHYCFVQVRPRACTGA